MLYENCCKLSVYLTFTIKYTGFYLKNDCCIIYTVCQNPGLPWYFLLLKTTTLEQDLEHL